MRGRLVRNRLLFDVPSGLTYFVNDQEYLVVNPESGGRCLLSKREFDVLITLSGPQAGPESTPLEETEETEKALARLILNWIVYFNGSKPAPKITEPPLNSVYYAVTDGCNLRCPYCYASSEKCLPGELGTDESLALIAQIADFGASNVVFTGGEPMLRKDLFTLVEKANSSGLKSDIITNATMIRKPATAQRFAELFNSVTISLDGGTAETHDRTRGKGSFAKTFRAIQLLNEVGVAPQINHIVTSGSVDELESFATTLAEVKVRGVRLMNHNNLGRGVSDEFDFGWQDHLRTQQLIWTSPAAGKMLADGPRPAAPCSVKGNCGMGGNEIYINSLGDVYPCKLVTGPGQLAGNVRLQSLSEIFGGPLLRQMRTSTVYGGEYHADCAKCYIKPFCGGGCRAYHLSESGDLKRNSRHLCRILRHGLATQLWQETGVTRAELSQHGAEMTVPRLVATGETHPVYDDWKTYVPLSRGVIKPGELIPIMPVQKSPAPKSGQRSAVGVSSDQ